MTGTRPVAGFYAGLDDDELARQLAEIALAAADAAMRASLTAEAHRYADAASHEHL